MEVGLSRSSIQKACCTFVFLSFSHYIWKGREFRNRCIENMFGMMIGDTLFLRAEQSSLQDKSCPIPSLLLMFCGACSAPSDQCNVEK